MATAKRKPPRSSPRGPTSAAGQRAQPGRTLSLEFIKHAAALAAAIAALLHEIYPYVKAFIS